MYQCNRCHKTFQDKTSEGVEEIFGKLYCVGCGEQLVEVGPQSPTPARQPSERNISYPNHVTDNSVSSTSNSNNTTITNIYKNGENEKVETRYGVYKKEDVSLCKSCREYIPKSYFIADTGVCQDCMVKIQMEEGDGALGEGLYEEARDCYEKVLRNTYGNDGLRQELLFKLGRCYFELRDGKNAVGYFAKTRNNFPDSIYYLGRCSEMGLGKEKDEELAKKYYHEAAQKGSNLAQIELNRIEQESLEKERLELEALEKSAKEEVLEAPPTQDQERDDDTIVPATEDISLYEDVTESTEDTQAEAMSIHIPSPENENFTEQEAVCQGPGDLSPDEESLRETPIADSPQPPVQEPIASAIQQQDIKNPQKKYGKLIGGACVVIIILATFFIFSNKEKNIEKILLNSTEKSLITGEEDTLVATIYPEEAERMLKWESSDNHIASVNNGIVTAHNCGEVIISVSSIKNDVRAECKYTITSPQKGNKKKVKGRDTNVNYSKKEEAESSSNSVDLGWAKFDGPVKNGKPDGAGMMIFKQHHLAGRDFSTGEEVYAESGEKLDGIFSNGYLQVGTLYKKDGNVKKLKY